MSDNSELPVVTVARLETRMDALESKVEEIKNEMRQGFRDLSNKLEKMNDHYASNSRVDKVERKAEGLSNKAALITIITTSAVTFLLYYFLNNVVVR